MCYAPYILFEYTLNPNSIIEIEQNFDHKVIIVQVLTLAFLCENLDYTPQSINRNHYMSCKKYRSQTTREIKFQIFIVNMKKKTF